MLMNMKELLAVANEHNFAIRHSILVPVRC